MNIEISIGEVLDKYGVLQIRQQKITDATTLTEINKEIAFLQTSCEKLLDNDNNRFYYKILMHINSIIWELSNKISAFDQLFQVYSCSDDSCDGQLFEMFDGKMAKEYAKYSKEMYNNNQKKARVKRLFLLPNGENSMKLRNEKPYAYSGTFCQIEIPDDTILSKIAEINYLSLKYDYIIMDERYKRIFQNASIDNFLIPLNLLLSNPSGDLKTATISKININDIKLSAEQKQLYDWEQNSSLRLKNDFYEKMMKDCFLLFHLSTGDNFTVYAMVMHFREIYGTLHIFCLPRNIETVTQLYKPFKNIKIHKVLGPTTCNVPDCDFLSAIFQCNNSYDVIKTGAHTSKQLNHRFWRDFYSHANLSYDIRYNYNQINRNMERERNLYDKVVALYGLKYIFVHDHRHHSTHCVNPRPPINLKPRDLPIFHPNTNYQNPLNIQDENMTGEKNKWTPELCSNNLLDYGLLMENATELYLTDSCFACLCPYLDLSKVKNKVLYTHLKCDMVDYHKSFADSWTITFESPQ